jgi:hypothetical protein
MNPIDSINQGAQGFDSTKYQSVGQPHYANGIGGFLQKAAPVIGSTVGMIAGIPLDAFTGGMASVGLGAAGGAIGQKIENSQTGSKGSTLEQGIFGAIPGGLGKASDVIKGLKAGAGATDSILGKFATSKFASPEVSAATAQSTDQLPTGLKATLNRTGMEAQKSAGGYGVGSKLPGTGPGGISQAQSDAMLATDLEYGHPTTSAGPRINAIANSKNAVGKQISDTLAQNNAPVTVEDRQAIMDSARKSLGATANDPAVQAHLNSIEKGIHGVPPKLGNQKLSQGVLGALDDKGQIQSPAKDLLGLHNFKSGQNGLDSMIYNAKSGDAATNAQATAASAVRNAIRDHINAKAPDLTVLNADYHNLSDLQVANNMAHAAEQRTGGGVLNQLIKPVVAGPEQTAKAVIGKAIQAVTGGAGAAGNLVEKKAATVPAGYLGKFAQSLTPKNIASKTFQQAGVRALAGGGMPNQTQQTTQQSSTGGINTSNLSDIASQLDQLSSGNSTPAVSTQQLEAALAADPKHAATTLAEYKALNDASASPKLSVTEQNNLDNLKSAAISLQQYLQQLQQIPNVGPGTAQVEKTLAGIPGLNKLAGNTGTQIRALEAQRTDIASMLAKSLTGTSRPAAAVIKQWADSIPNATDTPQVAQQKYDYLTSQIKARYGSAVTPAGK